MDVGNHKDSATHEEFKAVRIAAEYTTLEVEKQLS